MARPFYSAPVKLRPDFPLLPGQVVLPPPHLLTPSGPRAPPPPGGQPPSFHSDKPWMTAQLVAEIRRRNQLQARAQRSGAEQDRAAAEHHRQLVNRLVSDAKERFCLAHPERTDEILSSDRRARPFHCGSCDRSYGSQQQLDEHCREHVRCGLEGCPFTAHPRVVEKHVTMQHQTGLAKVIMSLNTPEAIARWREQRRANFCRPESAARRRQEQEERAARGLRMGRGRGRFPPRQERAGRGRGAPRPGQWRGRGRGSRSRPPEPAPLDSDSDGEPAGRLPPFAGILTAPAAEETGGEEAAAAESPTGAVASGSGSDAGPVAPLQSQEHGEVSSEAVQTQGTGKAPSDAALQTQGPGEALGEAALQTQGTGEAPSVAVHPGDAIATSPGGAAAGAPAPGLSLASAPDAAGRDKGGAVAGRGRGSAGGRGRRRGGPRPGPADQPPRQPPHQPPRKRPKRLTLLEKLLAADIERERNIILQCVRHITNENFFDGRPLGGGRAAPPQGEAPEVPVSSERAAVGPRPPESEAADGGSPPPSARPEAAPTDTSPGAPAAPPSALRLLGGAYDSDVITDSD